MTKRALSVIGLGVTLFACEANERIELPTAAPIETMRPPPQAPPTQKYSAGYGQCGAGGPASNGRFFKGLTQESLCAIESARDLCLDQDPHANDTVAVSVERCRELCGDVRVNYCRVDLALGKYTDIYGRRFESPDGGITPGACPFAEAVTSELEKDPYRLECLIYVDVVGDRYDCKYGNPSSSVASCRSGWRP